MLKKAKNCQITDHRSNAHATTPQWHVESSTGTDQTHIPPHYRLKFSKKKSTDQIKFLQELLLFLLLGWWLPPPQYRRLRLPPRLQYSYASAAAAAWGVGGGGWGECACPQHAHTFHCTHTTELRAAVALAARWPPAQHTCTAHPSMARPTGSPSQPSPLLQCRCFPASLPPPPPAPLSSGQRAGGGRRRPQDGAPVVPATAHACIRPARGLACSPWATAVLTA